MLTKFETPTQRATQKRAVLAIGPWDRGEFSRSREQIRALDEWLVAKDISISLESLRCEDECLELILLAEPLPGTYRQEDIEQLRKLVPLTRIIIVAGTWCEGELRTGKPIQGVSRLYWYELATWWHANNLSLLGMNDLDGPYAPRLHESFNSEKIHGIAAIRAHSCETYETLAAILEPCGMQCVWCRTEMPKAASLGIWDGGQLDAREFSLLKDFAGCIQNAGGSVVTLLDFPRKERFAMLEQIGCTLVLAKPYVVDELLAACAEAIKQSSPILESSS